MTFNDITNAHVIDAHVHIWTPDLKKYPLAQGYKVERMQPPSFTAEQLLKLARPIGIQRIVLIQMDFYRWDNSYMLDAIAAYPGVFSGVAQVDEHTTDPVADMRRLQSLGVRGIRILPPKTGDATWLDSPAMQEMWQCGADEQIAICPLINAVDLRAVAKMCEKHPNTTVVIDHCARIGGDGEFRDADVKDLCDMSRFPNTYVKLSAFYYLGNKKPPHTELAPLFRKLLDAFGPERLMWASDNPFQLEKPNTYEDSLALIRDRLEFLDDKARSWILRRTAEKVFFAGIEEPRGM